MQQDQEEDGRHDRGLDEQTASLQRRRPELAQLEHRVLDGRDARWTSDDSVGR